MLNEVILISRVQEFYGTVKGGRVQKYFVGWEFDMLEWIQTFDFDFFKQREKPHHLTGRLLSRIDHLCMEPVLVGICALCGRMAWHYESNSLNWCYITLSRQLSIPCPMGLTWTGNQLVGPLYPQEERLEIWSCWHLEKTWKLDVTISSSDALAVDKQIELIFQCKHTSNWNVVWSSKEFFETKCFELMLKKEILDKVISKK